MPIETASSVCSANPNDRMELVQNPQKRTAAIATIGVHLILLLLFLIFGLTYKYPIPQDGFLVNFGDSPTGIGEQEPDVSGSVPQEVQETEEENSESTPTTTTEPEENDPIVTQEEQEALEAAEAQRKAEEAAQKAEEERLEEERRKKEEQDKKNTAFKKQVTDIWNKSKQEGGSQGTSPGPGNQGDPNGSKEGTSPTGGRGPGFGDGWSLVGRTLLKGSTPRNTFTEEGKVVVSIKVNRQGKVIQAMPGAQGSNTVDKRLLQLAKEAALKYKFSANPNGPAEQMGRIEFIFKLE